MITKFRAWDKENKEMLSVVSINFDEKLINQLDLLRCHKLYDGVQYIYHFSDSKGASVVRHYGSYGSKEGLYELVPIVIEENDFHINEEPTGWLTVDEVLEKLEGIRNENKN